MRENRGYYTNIGSSTACWTLLLLYSVDWKAVMASRMMGGRKTMWRTWVDDLLIQACRNLNTQTKSPARSSGCSGSMCHKHGID